jgi:Uma2 family endonuclease
MATAATKLMTAEEFFAWVHRPENRDRSFELDRREVIQIPSPGKYHGFVCANVAQILGLYAAQRRRGYVCTNDSGVVVERDPDTVRGPDVSYYEDDETAADMERRYAGQPPRAAVEVLSPDDRLNRVIRRITQLLNGGVQMVWLVDRAARDVSVYRPGRDPVLLEEHEELSGDDVLPGFRCKVADLFIMPGG